jgi:hypothetical protein
MSKKLILSILIVFIFLGISVSKAHAEVLDSVNPVRRFSVEISFIAPSSTTVSIFHIPIERVSVNMRLLVATGTVSLSGDSTELGSLLIEYYTDNNINLSTGSITSAALAKAANKSVNNVLTPKAGAADYSFVTEPVLVDANAEYIYYRIKAAAKDGTVGIYPADDLYIEANLKQIKSQNIDNSGGSLSLHSGDHTRGNTTINFAPGSLLSDSTFRIKELYTSETLPYLGNLRPVITYEFTPADIIVNTQSLMPSITMYYGDMLTNANNIEVRWFNGTSWERVNFTNDTDMRTVTVTLALTGTKLGYYALFEKVVLRDNDYRPEYRVLKFGDKTVFRNLQAGDVVTIFDINGRRIRRLIEPPFEWDGRKDNGSYAESGSYIYQIKVDGKIISGSIAFVR